VEETPEGRKGDTPLGYLGRKEGAVWCIYTMQELSIETRSHDYATVDKGVFSVLSHDESHITSPNLLPGSSYKQEGSRDAFQQ
jgi:hypothetical protein